MRFLTTKLCPPVEPGALVNRTRLQQQLSQAECFPLTLIQAPAGYGKSCALSQWYHLLKSQQQTVGWLTINSTDRDAISVLSYLAASINCLPAELNSTDNPGNPMFDTPESLINYLVGQLEHHPAPVFFCLDDVHLLTASAQQALGQLLDLAPAHCHFLLASRTVPDLHIARARAHGELLEIVAEDLMFNRQEIQHYMDSHSSLKPQDLDILKEKTEGWIAGIKLFSLALRNDELPAETLLNSFSGNRRSVSDFFAEEVLSSLPGKIADFLMKTSILEQLSPALCNAVTGDSNARQLLNEIEASGLFLVRLDDERNWYRYHHLFSEFLQRRLEDSDPQLKFELYQCASHWCWQAEQYDQAIEYALKGPSPDRAVKLLEQRCQDMAYTGKFQLVTKFVAQMPQSLLEQHPRIQLTLAWLSIRNLQFSETRQILDTVRSIINDNEAAKTASKEELQQLRYLLMHREMMLAAAEDNAPVVEKLCRTLLDDFPDEHHPYLSGTIHGQLLYALREQYKLKDVGQIQAMVQGILNRSSYSFASIALQASIGPSLFFSGHTDAARRALEQGLAEGIRYGGQRSALAALPALPLAEILYEANEIERARQLVESTLPFSTEMGFIDQLMPGFITLARIRYCKNQISEAFQILDEGLSLATERNLERLRLALAGEYTRLLIHSRNPKQALKYAQNTHILPDQAQLMPSGKSTSVDEMRAIIWVRLEISQDRTVEAINIAKHWRRFCASRGAIRSLIQWNLLLAQLHFVAGDNRAAQRALREAMTHAAANKLIRSFIDEGPAILTLLSAASNTAPVDKLHPTDVFANQLLQAFNANKACITKVDSASNNSQDEGLYGKLTTRELEILSLEGSGMRNKEVALRLGMTEGSVKWYMQQIYDKLGTRRRLQAVERARQFGLIG